MTVPVAIKAMLYQMGFTPEDQDQTYETTRQSIQCIGDFGQFNEESVKTLYNVLCRPGRTVTAGESQAVDNGVTISEMDETNHQGMVHFISHYDIIARVIVPPNITLVKV